MNATVIFNKFYHLGGDELSISELWKESLRCKALSCMFRGHVNDKTGKCFPYLSFIMKNRLHSIKIIIYLFDQWNIWSLCVDPTDAATCPLYFGPVVNLSLTRRISKEEVAKQSIKRIMNGKFISMGRPQKELNLFNQRDEPMHFDIQWRSSHNPVDCTRAEIF